MIIRKNVGSPSPFLLVLPAFGSFIATYNLCIMIMHKSGRSATGDFSDPITTRPDGVISGGKFHVALTATNAPYSKWQCRVMYYLYKKMKDLPGSDMGGFTRVLHSGDSDNLMDEISTVIVDPLPDGLDRGYIVLNRPWAFVQWLEKAVIEEEYIIMAEPDHIFVNPLPNLARGDNPVAFSFFYIKPANHENIVRKYYTEELGPMTNVDPIGNSPVIIKKPPWDKEIGKKFIIHCTYGCDYNMKGELTYGKIGEWRFDKRSHLRGPPPRNLSLPPQGVPESVLNFQTLPQRFLVGYSGIYL